MISVLVVDDSALVRRLVTGVLDGSDGIRVVGSAANGVIALRKVQELRPDVITLDIEMPEMDGLTTLRELRRRHPRLPVIMLSTLTVAGASATLDALTAGASDYVTKPTNAASLTASLADLRAQLVPRVQALARRARPAPAAAAAASRAAAGTDAGRRTIRTRPAASPEVLAIGSSTGGPDALARVLSALDRRVDVPVLIVQHMPPVFTAMLAQRLDRVGPLGVVEATDGQRLEPGVAYVAPGGRHLEVVRRGPSACIRLHDGEQENYSRPSVDVLFRSVAVAFPGSAIGVVLTGMGHDGRAGCAQLGRAGSLIVAQDEASSVVWGMPGAVTEAGLADVVLPLGDIGRYVSDRVAERSHLTEARR